jgi:hypothetical protein
MWGNYVGILKAPDEGRFPQLEDQLFIKTVRGCLESSNCMNIFKTSYNRFTVRFARGRSGIGLLSRTRWAIHDKDKFGHLIRQLKYFIDGLDAILPVP